MILIIYIVTEVFGTMAACAAMVPKTSITMSLWQSTGCSSLMIVYVNRKVLEQLLLF